MPDDSILRIGTAVDLAPLKSGMQEAAATVRNQLRAIADESRQTAAAIRQNLTGMGGEALASQIEQATTKAVGALSELESAQSGLASNPAALAPLQAIRQQIEADLTEERAVLEQLQERSALPASASSGGGVVSTFRPEANRQGNPLTVPVPGEAGSYEGRYVLRELADVQASHSGQSFQPNPLYAYRNDRDYGNAGNAERVVRQAAAFDPHYLLNDNPDAVNGPPIVDPRGNVLGGNSRAMTLERVYAQHPEAAQRYKDLLASKAAGFGIDPAQVQSFAQPVLVREIGQPANPQNAITDFNKTGTAALTGSERAVADARRLSPGLLEHLGNEIAAEGDDGTLAKVLGGSKGPRLVQRLIDEGVIAPQERPQYLDERGLVTPEGKQRITRSVVGRFFETPEDYDNAAPELRNKLERVAGPLASLEGRPEWNITGQTKGAVGILGEARARGVRNLSDLETQNSLFPGANRYSPEEMALARVLQQHGPRKVQDLYQQFAGDARFNDNESFSFIDKPTPGRSFDAFRRAAGSEETGALPQPAAGTPPAPPPPPPPSAPPSAPPPDDDGEEKRRQRELAAREQLAAQEKEIAAQVAANDIAAAEESAAAQKAALARVAAARKEMEAQRSKPLSSATIDADLELQAAEKELAALQGTKAEETAVAEQAAERRTQAARQAAEAETTAAATGARAVESAAQSATGSVLRSTEERKGAIAGIGVLEQETAEQSAAAVAEAAAAKTASIQESTAAAAEASAGQAAAQIESVQQARAAQEEAATGLRARLQSAAGQIRNSFRELWEGVKTSAVEANAGITQAVAESGEAQVHAGAATATTLRQQLGDLQKQRKAAAKEEESAYGQLAEVQAIFAQRAANGDRAAAAVLAEYTAQLDAAKAKTQQLAAETDQVALSLKEVGSAAVHTVPQMAAASGAIRVFEGQMPIRAVERFLSTVLGLAPVLQAAFPVVGAIALGEMLVEVAGKVHDLYENFVNLKDIQEEVEQVELRLAKATETAFAETQRNAADHLRRLGKEVEAAKLDAQNLESRPIDLQQFLSDKTIEQKFKSLPEEMREQFRETYGDIIPSQLPGKIAELTKRFEEAGEAAKKIRVEQTGLRTAPSGPYGGGGGGLETLSLEHQARQQEVAAEVYGGLLQFLKQEQDKYKSDVVKAQDDINDAQGRELIRGAEQQIALLKQQGRDSASAEKEIWQGILSQLHEGTAAYREVENKLGSAGTKRDRSTVAQELRKADQDELTEMQLHAAETGQAQEALLAQEESFVRRRIEAERQYVDNLRALRSELVRIEQEEERARIQSENRHAATLVTPEGKPDYAARLDYYNSIIANAADAKNAVQELENAEQHAAVAGAEAIRQTNEDVKQSVEREYDAWIAAGHRTDAEVAKFWEDVKTRYAADAPLVEEALHKIAEALAKVREEQEKLQLGGLTLRHEANQDQFAQQEASVKATYSLGGETSPDRRRELTELMRIHAEQLQEEIRFLAQMAQLESSEGHQTEALRSYEKILAAQRQYHKQRIADETQLTLEIEKPYRRLFSTLEQDMRSALNQMMSGQRTFGQAMAGLWNNLVEQVGAGIATMVMRWLAGEILMTVAHAAANQTRVASDASAASQSTAIHEAANLKQKLSDAKVAAAEAFKATVGIPVIGPVLAPIAAAGAFAAVASLDTGGYVTRDGMAMLHQNEVVVNHPITQMLGDMAAQGNAYRDTAAPQAIVPMHPALFQPPAVSGSSHPLHTSLQQILAHSRGGDTHFHAHVTSSPTFHGAKEPDMRALLSEHADHIGRLVHRQMKQYNR